MGVCSPAFRGFYLSAPLDHDLPNPQEERSDRTAFAERTPYAELATLDAKESAARGRGPFVPPPTHVAFSSDGKKVIALVGMYKHSWELEPKKNLGRKKLGAFIFAARSGSLAHDGKTMTLVRDRGEVELWALDTEIRKARLEKAEALLATFSPDAKAVAVSTLDHSLEVIDVATGTPRFEKHFSSIIRSIAFAADGKRVAVGCVDGDVELFDAQTGAKKAHLSHRWLPVLCLAIDPDCKLVAAGYEDNRVLVWNIATQDPTEVIVSLRPQGTLGPHPGLTSVAFAPDGRLVATGSTDGSVKLWGPKEAKPQK